MASAKVIERLEREHADLGERRRRQLRLFASTKLRGHARKATDLGYRMRHKRTRIDELKTRPSWKLKWAARFVAPFEGLRTTTYLDSGGIRTIGFGHTGKYATPGNTISEAFALTLLASDLREAARAVDRNVNVPLSVRERIAAISFTFNVGEGGLQSSTFLRKLNAGDRRGAANALLMWVKDDHGNTLAGLQRRRRAERWLFLNPRK